MWGTLGWLLHCPGAQSLHLTHKRPAPRDLWFPPLGYCYSLFLLSAILETSVRSYISWEETEEGKESGAPNWGNNYWEWCSFIHWGIFSATADLLAPALKPLGKPPDKPGSIFTAAHSSQRRHLMRDGGRTKGGDEYTGLGLRPGPFSLLVSSKPDAAKGGVSQLWPSLCPWSGFFSDIEITSWAQGGRCSLVLVQPSLSTQSTAHTHSQGDRGLCVPWHIPHGERHSSTPAPEMSRLWRSAVETQSLPCLSRLVVVLVCKSLAVKTARALSYSGPCDHIPRGQTSTATCTKRQDHPHFFHPRFVPCWVFLNWSWCRPHFFLWAPRSHLCSSKSLNLLLQPPAWLSICLSARGFPARTPRSWSNAFSQIIPSPGGLETLAFVANLILMNCLSPCIFLRRNGKSLLHVAENRAII